MKHAGLLLVAALVAVIALVALSRTPGPEPEALALRTPVALPRIERGRTETALVLAASTDLGVSGPELGVVAMANADLQLGREALFADLAARRIDNTAVSQGLHELRRAMHVRLEAALGPDRTKQLEERMRDAHRLGAS